MAVTISGSGVVTGLDSEGSSDLGSKLDAAGGLVMVTPTTIANSGGTATLTDGAVSFSGVSSVSLNGVFTSAYQNYVVVTSGIRSAAGAVLARLRSSGTDDSNTAYVTQYIQADSTTIAGARSTQNYWEVFRWDDNVSAATITLFQPKDATRTVFTSESIYAFSDAYIRNFVGSFTNDTSFDGITFYVSSGTITGTIRVYGYRNGI